MIALCNHEQINAIAKLVSERQLHVAIVKEVREHFLKVLDAANLSPEERVYFDQGYKQRVAERQRKATAANADSGAATHSVPTEPESDCPLPDEEMGSDASQDRDIEDDTVSVSSFLGDGVPVTQSHDETIRVLKATLESVRDQTSTDKVSDYMIAAESTSRQADSVSYADESSRESSQSLSVDFAANMDLDPEYPTPAEAATGMRGIPREQRRPARTLSGPTTRGVVRQRRDPV